MRLGDEELEKTIASLYGDVFCFVIAYCATRPRNGKKFAQVSFSRIIKVGKFLSSVHIGNYTKKDKKKIDNKLRH